MPTWSAEELIAQRQWLHALARRLVRAEAERDDLVQETWLAALRRPAPDTRDPRQWFAAILRNRWRQARRSEERRQGRERTAATTGLAPAAAELAEQAELQRVLVGAVLALAEPQRSTVLLRYFGGLTSRAIARREGVPEGTVRSRLKRAMDQLREELDRRHHGERRAWATALVPLARLAPGPGAPLVASAAVALLFAALLAWSWTRTRVPAVPGTSTSAVATAELDSAPPLAAPAPAGGESREVRAGGPLPGGASPLIAVRELELRILDDESRPIPGASLAFEGMALVCSADEHGLCLVPDEAWTSGALHLRASAPGFAHRDANLERGSLSFQSAQPLCLSRAAALEGRVRAADTLAPLADVELLAWDSFCDTPVARARSAPDGRFRLSPVPAGQTVELVIHSPTHGLERRRLQVPAWSTPPLEILLPPAVELLALVVDGASGAPLPGARACFERGWFEGSPSEHALELGRSDASGMLRLLVPRGEAPDVLVTAPGYCTLRFFPRPETSVLPLVPGATLEGSVRDTAGRPCSGTRIALHEPSGKHLRGLFGPDAPLAALPGDARVLSAHQATTDAEGHFRLEGVLPGLPQLGAGGGAHVYRTVPIDPPLLARETRAFELTLSDAFTLRGRLRIDGEPRHGWVLGQWSGGNASAWTRADGSFELHTTANGSVQLFAGPDEWNKWRASTRLLLAEVEVPRAEPVELELTLEMGTIRGRVTDTAGEPVPWETVWVADEGWQALTDEQGLFELAVPRRAEPYELQLQIGARARAPVDSEGVVLVAPTWRRIRVRVDDAETGECLAVPELFARRAGGEWQVIGGLGAGPDGFVELILEDGWIELAAGQAEEGYPAVPEAGLALAGDGVQSLRFALTRVPTAEFRLAQGPLPEACVLWLERTDGAPFLRGSLDPAQVRLDLPFSARTDACVPGLAHGSYRIVPSFPDVRVEPAEIELGPERSTPFELSWRREP